MNRDDSAIDGLFKFLKSAKIPINKEGNILTYKKINKNYTDCYTGKISNKIGETVTMPREKVDDNPNQTCSSGLHVCSYSYLSAFGGEKLVVCEVEPQNVVAVPNDYNNAKMRCCEYKIIKELKNGKYDILKKQDDCIYM